MLFITGEKYPDFIGETGTHFGFEEDGSLQILVRFVDPTEKEKNEIKNGKFKFHPLYLNGLVWAIFKFGKLAYMDATFYNKIAPHDGHKHIKNIVNLFFADGANGKLLTMKSYKIKNSTRDELQAILNKQMEDDISMEQYQLELNSQYQEYQTQDLLKLALLSPIQYIEKIKSTGETVKTNQKELRKSLQDISHMVDMTKTYPDLPPQYEPFYYYVRDIGHALMAIPKSMYYHVEEGADPYGYELVAPVKTVLNSPHEIKDGFIILDRDYDPIFGLDIEDDEEEY